MQVDFWSRRGLCRRIVSGDLEDAVDLPMGKNKMKEELSLQKAYRFLLFSVCRFELLLPLLPFFTTAPAVGCGEGRVRLSRTRVHTDIHF